MGNILKNKYNSEKDIKFDITLNKICYMPGEQIIGSLDILSKPGNNETILNDTMVHMKIIQYQQYSYIDHSGEDSETVSVTDERDVLSEDLDFINFNGANILSGINIPFSIQIPLDIHASVYYNGSCVKHFLSAEFPGIKARRALVIIIKRFEKFSYENKLSLNKFEIKDYIQLQNDSNFSKYISVNDKYCSLEEMKKIEVDYNFKNIILMPFCFGGLINPEFILQVDIIYKQHRSTSSFSIPIDFDECQNSSVNIDKIDKINNILNNHKNENKNNNSSSKDIKSTNEEDSKQNIADSEGFVVYEDDDFEKALFGDKNK